MAKHHFVPQFYLRNFKIPSSKEGIYAYSRDSAPAWRNITKVAQASNFYNFVEEDGTENKKLEPAFSVIESGVKPLIEAIVTSESLPAKPEDYYSLVFFVSTLITRNRAYRNKTETLQQAVQGALKKNFPGVENQDNMGHIFNDINDGDKLRIALSSAIEASKLINAKHAYILKSESEEFVTSDNPVLVCSNSPYHAEIHGTGAIRGSAIMLPLNPVYCLVFDDQEISEVVKTVSDDLVNEINWLIMVYAERNIFSSTNASELDEAFKKTTYGTGQAVEISFAGETNIYRPIPRSD